MMYRRRRIEVMSALVFPNKQCDGAKPTCLNCQRSQRVCKHLSMPGGWPDPTSTHRLSIPGGMPNPAATKRPDTENLDHDSLNPGLSQPQTRVDHNLERPKSNPLVADPCVPFNPFVPMQPLDRSIPQAEHRRVKVRSFDVRPWRKLFCCQRCITLKQGVPVSQA